MNGAPKKPRAILLDGLWYDNPIFRQILGICSTLAVTNQVLNTTFGVGTDPKGIVVTADVETIYVVNYGSESVSIRMY